MHRTENNKELPQLVLVSSRTDVPLPPSLALNRAGPGARTHLPSTPTYPEEKFVGELVTSKKDQTQADTTAPHADGRRGLPRLVSRVGCHGGSAVID